MPQRTKIQKKGQERKVLCIYSFHAVLCFVLWFRKTMEQPEVQQAMDLFRPINRWRFVCNSWSNGIKIQTVLVSCDYRNVCPKTNINLAASKWVTEQANSQVICLYQWFACASFVIVWMLCWLVGIPPIAKMQSSEQRECLNSVLKGALHVGLLAFDFIYSRCMQSASHGRIPSHISGKEKQVVAAKNLFACPQSFCQDMTEDVLSMMRELMPTYKTRSLFLLGRSGVGKTPLACVCAMAISRSVFVLFKRLNDWLASQNFARGNTLKLKPRFSLFRTLICAAKLALWPAP